MEVTVSTIHGTIPESLNEHAVRLSRRLDRYSLKAAAMAVSFEKVNGLRTVEVRLTTAGGPPMVGRGDGPTYRNALNQAIDRIERQVKRTRDRKRQRRRAAVNRG